MIVNLEEESEQISIGENYNADELSHLLPKISEDIDVLRIEEDVFASWSGVSGCCEQSTVDSNANSAFTKWVQEKLYTYRHLNYKTYGHGGGNARCSNSREPFPSNRRSCRGSIILKAHIEFYERK